jgi:hypothetical protein
MWIGFERDCSKDKGNLKIAKGIKLQKRKDQQKIIIQVTTPPLLHHCLHK